MGAKTPRVVDNDRDEITATLEGKEIRGWSYATEAERRTKMLAAREFCEGWFEAYDRGRRDMLNALLEPNPPVQTKLAHWAEKEPDPEGRMPFDVALWITEVAHQLGIKSQEELAEDRAVIAKAEG